MPTGSRLRSSGPSDPSRGGGWRQRRTGALLLVGLAVAGLAVFFLDEVVRELATGPRLVVAASEARGLKAGAPVWIAGVPAGRVTGIRFRTPDEEDDRRILIRAEIRADAAGVLRSDASASVRPAALLAPAVLAVDPGASAVPFDPADTLAAEPREDVRDVMARADSLAGRLDALRPLGRRLTRRLEDGPGTLASLRADPATVRGLRTALRAGTGLGREAGEGSAALLASDSTLALRWERIRRRAGEMGASGGEAAALVADLDRLVDRLARLGARLDSAHGSLGRFVHDDALRRERRRMEARVDSVRAALLADPLRWLRFRLF